MTNIYWFLSGNEQAASARIQCLRLHGQLNQNGICSNIIQKPKNLTNLLILSSNEQHYFVNNILKKSDLVVIHKLKCANTTEFAALVKYKGGKVVYFDCDFPVNDKLNGLTDLVVVPTTYLANLYELSGYESVVVLNDVPEIFHEPVATNRSTLKCIWFGYYTETRWSTWQWLTGILNKSFGNKIACYSISDKDTSDFRWDKNGLDLVSQFDCVLLPLLNPQESDKLKSTNKLIQSMALGLPVFCSPSPPSYIEALQRYEHDIVCHDESDWVSKVEKLFDNGYRNHLAKYNYEFSVNNYNIGEYYIAFIDSLHSAIPGAIERKSNRLIRRARISSFSRSISQNHEELE